MAKTVLYQEMEGPTTFVLRGDLTQIQHEIDFLKAMLVRDSDDWKEWRERRTWDEFGSGAPVSEEEDIATAQREIAELEAFFAEGASWKPHFDKIVRKKNNTFHKGRILELWRGSAFEYEDVESYGYRGPELFIRNISDTEAELVFDDYRIRKW
jgi:hypothetical protein